MCKLDEKRIELGNPYPVKKNEIIDLVERSSRLTYTATDSKTIQLYIYSNGSDRPEAFAEVEITSVGYILHGAEGYDYQGSSFKEFENDLKDLVFNFDATMSKRFGESTMNKEQLFEAILNEDYRNWFNFTIKTEKGRYLKATYPTVTELKRCVTPIFGKFEIINQTKLPLTVTQEILDECPETAYVKAGNSTWAENFYSRAVSKGYAYPIIRKNWNAYLVKDKEGFDSCQKDLVIHGIDYFPTDTKVGEKIKWRMDINNAEAPETDSLGTIFGENQEVTKEQFFEGLLADKELAVKENCFFESLLEEDNPLFESILNEDSGNLQAIGLGALTLGAMAGTGYLSMVDANKNAECAQKLGIEELDFSNHGSGQMMKDVYRYKYEGNHEMTPDALCNWLKKKYSLEEITYDDLGLAYRISYVDRWKTHSGKIHHYHRKESGFVIPKDYFDVSFIFNESDNKYKAKVAGKGWLKGNGFTDKEEDADTFESKTEPTQRINQMKKDGKLNKNAKPNIVKESHIALFDDLLKEYLLEDIEDFPKNTRAMYRFAKRRHNDTGAIRKVSKQPYWVHPEGVAKIVMEHGGSDIEIKAAMAHDTMEDAGVSYDDMVEKFGEKVASIVKEVTNDKDEIAKVGKEKYISEELCRLSPEALTVKLADMLYNMKDSPTEKNYERMRKNVAFLMMNRKLDGKHLELAQEIMEV